jgi:transposase
MSQRLAAIPGIGPIIATAIAATVAEPGAFHGGREFAAWLGLVPRQNSTGGKTRLGGISKRGDSYLRRLLVNGAHAALLRSKAAKADPWLIALRGRRPRLVVAVALANKTARIAWAMMTKPDSAPANLPSRSGTASLRGQSSVMAKPVDRRIEKKLAVSLGTVIPAN